MEIMDVLEGKIEALIEELTSAQSDKQHLLHEYQERIAQLITENTALKEDLQQEQQVKNEILGRIDGLLLRLKDRGTESEEEK